jgi:hypothetical protein
MAAEWSSGALFIQKPPLPQSCHNICMVQTAHFLFSRAYYLDMKKHLMG